MNNRRLIPTKRIIDQFNRAHRPSFALGVFHRSQYFSPLQLVCQLRRAITRNTEIEYLPHHFGGFFVDDPVILILRVFDVAERRNRRQRLSRLPLRLEHRTNLLAGVLGVPLVDDVQKRGENAILLARAVHAVIDGNEPERPPPGKSFPCNSRP